MWLARPAPASLLKGQAMSKKWIICAVILCAGVVAVEANKAKIKGLTPAGVYGPSQNPDCDGLTKLMYKANQQESKVHVHIHGFIPHEIYGVALFDAVNGQSFSDPLAITADEDGAGNYKIDLPSLNVTNGPMVVVYVWDGNFDPDAIALITDEELRAFGTAAP